MIREWERSLFYAVLVVGTLALVSVWVVESVPVSTSHDQPRVSVAVLPGDLAADWSVREVEPSGELPDNPMKARIPAHRRSNVQTPKPPVLVTPPPPPPPPPPLPPPPPPKVSHAIAYLGYLKVSGPEVLPYVRCVRRVNGRPSATETLFVRVGQDLFGCRVVACGKDGMTIKDRHGRVVTVDRNDLVPLGD